MTAAYGFGMFGLIIWSVDDRSNYNYYVIII